MAIWSTASLLCRIAKCFPSCRRPFHHPVQELSDKETSEQDTCNPVANILFPCRTGDWRGGQWNRGVHLKEAIPTAASSWIRKEVRLHLPRCFVGTRRKLLKCPEAEQPRIVHPATISWARPGQFVVKWQSWKHLMKREVPVTNCLLLLLIESEALIAAEAWSFQESGQVAVSSKFQSAQRLGFNDSDTKPAALPQRLIQCGDPPDKIRLANREDDGDKRSWPDWGVWILANWETFHLVTGCPQNWRTDR